MLWLRPPERTQAPQAAQGFRPALGSLWFMFVFLGSKLQLHPGRRRLHPQAGLAGEQPLKKAVIEPRSPRGMELGARQEVSFVWLVGHWGRDLNSPQGPHFPAGSTQWGWDRGEQ